MKKPFLFFVAAIIFLLTNSFIYNRIHDFTLDERYKVVSAIEYSKTGKPLNPIVTNVVYVDCKYHFDAQVSLELRDFYDAYYKADRNGNTIGTQTVFSFDTRDKAEKRRRELIADAAKRAALGSLSWKPLLIQHFKVLCDD